MGAGADEHRDRDGGRVQRAHHGDSVRDISTRGARLSTNAWRLRWTHSACDERVAPAMGAQRLRWTHSACDEADDACDGCGVNRADHQPAGPRDLIVRDQPGPRRLSLSAWT